MKVIKKIIIKKLIISGIIVGIIAVSFLIGNRYGEIKTVDKIEIDAVDEVDNGVVTIKIDDNYYDAEYNYYEVEPIVGSDLDYEVIY
jgi:uncharacterized protein YaiL (DUF2058 family)